MSTAREIMLSAIRTAVAGADTTGDRADAPEARLRDPPLGPIPERARRPRAALVELFTAMAEEADATVARVADSAAVPQAVAGYLAAGNLPTTIAMAPDPALQAVPWATAPLLTVRRGPAGPDAAVSVTGAAAGIAETGTLMLASGPDSPTTLNFLPETHIALLAADRVVGTYEEAWARLRAAQGATGAILPRSVNLITGPSRSADIEQTLQLGAHGPRRLHIVLIDGAQDR